ncbi:hypothetical protein BI343_02290 [Chromobacterium amazonense]|uniref:substrate-binding periplasmic protein n=1 Tax=Chromobacterium amazonense TaxID=1382803 RepID=UPI0008DACBB7|nr:ABC transporter substrate-binding protein [Chromobacterium amazonense]OHX15205.1 hypothetical protein BI343_02290 [Chromobacterium amazonense]
MKPHIVFFIFFALFNFSHSQAAEVIIRTYEFPNETDRLADDQIGGIAGKIITAALSAQHIRFQLIWQPWLRAQAEVKSDSEGNSFIIPLTRNSERENQYVWVSKLYDSNIAFLTLPGKTKIDSIAEVGKYKVGVLAGTGYEATLQRNGLSSEQIDRNTEETRNAKKLLLGRIDAWYTGVIGGMHLLQKEGYDVRKVQIGRSIDTEADYIATSKKTPQALVEKVRNAIERYKKTPDYEKLIQSYLSN